MNLGVPSVLARFQICNLRCQWCDSPLSQGRPLAGSGSLSLEEVVARIVQEGNKSSRPLRHAIFSGGEPTIHPIHWVRRALGSEWTVEVETNGTRIPHQEFSDFEESMYSDFQWNVSPKGMAAGEEIIPEAMEYWGRLAQTHGAVYFKYVIREEQQQEDLAEILDWCVRFQLPRDRVLLMPEGTSRRSQTGAVWLHDLCIEHNLRMAPRLHVLLFEDKKGV